MITSETIPLLSDEEETLYQKWSGASVYPRNATIDESVDNWFADIKAKAQSESAVTTGSTFLAVGTANTESIIQYGGVFMLSAKLAESLLLEQCEHLSLQVAFNVSKAESEKSIACVIIPAEMMLEVVEPQNQLALLRLIDYVDEQGVELTFVFSITTDKASIDMRAFVALPGKVANEMFADSMRSNDMVPVKAQYTPAYMYSSEVH